MTKNLIQLLYLSKSAPDIDSTDLADILATASKRNRSLGITGVLCHKGGYFMQLLEGEEIPVLELYLKIVRDPRHSDPVIVNISTATEQMFSGWAMGAVDANLLSQEYGEAILKLRNSSSEPGKALEMMRSLRFLLA